MKRLVVALPAFLLSFGTCYADSKNWWDGIVNLPQDILEYFRHRQDRTEDSRAGLAKAQRDIYEDVLKTVTVLQTCYGHCPGEKERQIRCTGTCGKTSKRKSWLYAIPT